jgi:integrase
MSKKAWKRAADGIWKNKSGTYYERPKIAGRWTYRSLKTKRLADARAEFHCRRAGDANGQNHSPAPAPAPVLPVVVPVAAPTQPSPPVVILMVGDLIRRYQADSYPDRFKQQRPEATRKSEEAYCETLLRFWEKIPSNQVSIAACDRYHTWRKANIKRGVGNRTVDLELNSLNSAFLWGCRCELIQFNPLSTNRPRYTSVRSVQHCRKFMPRDAADLHRVAGMFFAHPHRAPLGWQMLVEAATGLRTCEALALRTDAKPYTPGWITPDGQSLCVRRSKNQDGVSPFVPIQSDLKVILDSLFEWKRKHHPQSPWFFPSARRAGAVVDKSALSHALVRFRKAIGYKITSHGLRAYYVTVRRSNGIMDSQIAWEIGHTSGGATLAEVYGGVPPHWLAGNGPKLTWMPTNGTPAWSVFEATSPT